MGSLFTPSRARRGIPVLVGLALVVGACASEDSGDDSTTTSTTEPRSPEECADDAREVVGALQDFVDEYEPLSIVEWNALDPAPDLDALNEEVTAELVAIVDSGCDPSVVNSTVDAEVAALRGRSDLGLALAAALRGDAAPAGPPSPDPTRGREVEPSTVAVDTVDDLQGALARVAPGSRIEVAAGVYELDEPLLIDVAVELAGQGSDETVLRSSAEGNAFVFLGPGPLAVRSLALESTDDVVATVFVALVGGVELEEVRVSGGRAGDEGQTGGHGVAIAFDEVDGVAPRSPDQLTAPITVRNAEIVDNEGGGVLVTGSAAPTLDRNLIARNGQCGVCLSGESGGAFTANTVRRNGVGFQIGGASTPTIETNDIVTSQRAGVMVVDEAAPLIRENTFTDDADVAVQAFGSSAPTIEANTIAAPANVGVMFLEESQGSADANTVSEAGSAGFLVAGTASPTLRGNVVSSGVVGAAYSDGGAGRAVANTFDGAQIGVQVGADAQPVVARNTFLNMGEAAALYDGAASGRFESNLVSRSGSFGVQIGDTAAPDVLDNVFEEIDIASIVAIDSAGGTFRGNTCPDDAAIGLAPTATAVVDANDCATVELDAPAE